MPTYEYECRECGYRFEKFQSISDFPLKRCPQCGGDLRRLIHTGAGIIFKGPGFYATDYKNSSGKTCCGRDEPCSNPPCSNGECRRK